MTDKDLLEEVRAAVTAAEVTDGDGINDSNDSTAAETDTGSGGTPATGDKTPVDGAKVSKTSTSSKEPKGATPSKDAGSSETSGDAPAGGDKAPASGDDSKILAEDKAPSAWSPAAREKWNSIPADIRQEIVRREEASVAGVRQLKEQYVPMERFIQSISPVLQDAQRAGVAPHEYIGGVMQSAKLLQTADTPAKFQEILRIADQFGVPLREVINASVGQDILSKSAQPQTNIPPELAAELREMRQWRSQFEDRSVNTQIEEFAKSAEFFNDVHSKMAGIFDAGMANTLQEAYDQACWATPNIREVLLQRQQHERVEKGVKEGQKVAAGASIKPSGSTEDIVVDDENEDLHETVRKQFIRSTSGRV
jgi:hypothetical protein